MVNKITNPPSQKDLIDKVNELVDDKQDALVSGTNIKTINNTSILGSGNIDIQGGGSSYTAGTGIDINNDVISVTNDISAGAALGATALQSGDNISELVNNSGYITSSALTPYALSVDLASVATSGSYDDLINKPTIPAAQVNSDWDATSGVAQILNKPTIPTVNNPTITFTQGGTTKGTITLNQLGDQTIAFDAGGGARNIGQIIQSTIPLTDAGLHLLDGTVISGDGIYSEFYNYIAGIVNTYPNLFVTEAAWQAEVASHGVCGKFVFYEPNRTVRLPKITGITQSSESINALGDYIAAGLPNITATGTIGTIGSHAAPTISGAFVNLRNGSVGSDEPNTTGWLYDLDASRSNGIYGNSSTVQPQSIKVLYYIVVANSTKTDIEVDIDEIVTDLNGKADVDLSNCTKPHIVETYVNGTSWYRVYSDGWCEQGGGDITTSGNVNFLKPFINTNYCLVGSIGYGVNSNTWEHYHLQKESTNYFYQNCCFDGYRLVSWYACGYIS